MDLVLIPRGTSAPARPVWTSTQKSNCASSAYESPGLKEALKVLCAQTEFVVDVIGGNGLQDRAVLFASTADFHT